MRRLLHALVFVLTLVIGMTSAAAIVSQTSWFRNWLRGYIVHEAKQYVNGTLSIERLSGNLFFGVEMENIGLSMDGSQVVAVKSLGLDYNLFQLMAKGLSVNNIRLDHPVIYLRRDRDGWSLSRLVKKQETEADRQGPTRPMSIDAIGIRDGSVVFESPAGVPDVSVPKRFDHLDAKLSFSYEPVRYSIQIAQVSFRASDPELALNALSGGVSVKDDTVFLDRLAMKTAETSLTVDGAVQRYLTTPVFNLQVSADTLSMPEIARIVPALAGIRLQPSLTAKTSGPLDRLSLQVHVQSSAGAFSGTVVADLASPGQSVAGDLSVRHLDLAPLLNDPGQRSDITANAHVDLHGEALSNVRALHGDMTIDAPSVVAAGYVAERLHAKAHMDGRRVDVDGRAAAYGADATVAGRVTLPDESAKGGATAYDLHGVARHVDARKLPRDLHAPPAATDVNAAYHVVGSVESGSSRTVVDASVVSGFSRTTVDVRFEPSTVAGAHIASGGTAGVVLNGSDVSYTADVDVAGLDLQRVGEQFQLPALADARYASAINGHVTAKGRGTAAADLAIDAQGTLHDSSILGGQVAQLTFDASLADDTAHVKATGGFSEFDPAVASGHASVKGTVAGTLDVDATLTDVSSGVTPDSVEADAKITLGPSTIGGLAVTRATVDGTYHAATGDIRTLEIVGRDVNLTASGRLALDDSGQSNLKVHATSPTLETIGKLADLPISGIGTVDATVTGNKRELQANGTASGGDLTYGDTGALTLSSTFTATIPELTMADANVVATTHATFVTIGGQTVNELDAKTTYAQQHVDFDATAKQPQRQLGITGAVLLHPDHQEVHLQKLGLQAQGQTWQLAPGAPATINYAREGAIHVEHVTLTNGDQRIDADGTFGRIGDAMTVTLTNVDVAGVNALLLRPPQFTGRLTASGTVGGTSAAPSVDATFDLTQGGFNQFKYDSLGGTIRYAGAGITLDTKLQQNPTTFLTAKGYVPLKLFKGEATDGAAPADAATVSGDRIDLHVESTPIDLGLVQGFTNAITNVKGTLQAKVDIGGSASDPRPTGVVSVAGGAFTVPNTGGVYTNLQGQIDLQPDKLHIDNISILDNQQSALSITGDLAIHEGQVGGVELYVTARDFKIIDNKLGKLRIDSDMQIAGELSAPRIEGDLAVNTGSVDLDQVLAGMNNSAYSTEQTQYETAEAAAAAADKPARPSPFDALQASVHFTVPSDLVVKANDLRAPGAPIGLGALNVTLGGDLWISKTPWDQVRLVGTVTTVRGTYDFQGRRFDILRDGTVRFQGTDDLDPTLDVRTQRIIQAVTANVVLRGTLRQPEIVLSSTPPLEQADILSLIVFNQPINQLGEGQQTSLAVRAQQLATGAVAGQLAQSIGKSLGLDTFEISTAPDSGAAARFTIGQQLGQNLYVRVQQDLGDQSQTNFILEYELTKWLRLQTNVLQGSSTQSQLFQRMQGSGIDLLFFFSY